MYNESCITLEVLTELIPYLRRKHKHKHKIQTQYHPKKKTKEKKKAFARPIYTLYLSAPHSPPTTSGSSQLMPCLSSLLRRFDLGLYIYPLLPPLSISRYGLYVSMASKPGCLVLKELHNISMLMTCCKI